MNYTYPATLLCDFYKVSHREQYPEKTELVYGTWIARKSRIEGINKVVSFGLQAFIKEFLMDYFQENFFDRTKEDIVNEYVRVIKNTLGVEDVDTTHLEALHDLQYIPLKIMALPEGTRVPIGVPMFSIENTVPEFFWFTNYIETLMSASIWQGMTSATIAFEYRKLLESYAKKTVDSVDFVPFQGHDFSMRGMSSLASASISGAGHALSFVGSDTIPALFFLEKYYNANCEKELIISSIPACYDSETEVLTENGWKLFVDLVEDEKVAQYHEDGKVTFVVPTDYVNKDYKGEMISFVSGGYHYVDVMVTPNHRMIKRSIDGELSVFSANADVGFKHDDKMIVSGNIAEGGGGLTPLEQLKIAFQADGAYPNRKDSYNGKRTGKIPIRFSLKKERKKERLIEICESGDFEYTMSQYKNGYYSFWIKLDEGLSKTLDWINLSTISKNWADEFIEELTHWDGNKHVGNTLGYSSTVKSNVDMVHAIASISGRKGQYSFYQDKRTDSIRQPMHSIIVQHNREIVGGHSADVKVFDYSGTVHCVSVPTKMLFVRKNNVVCVSGNSEHSVMSSYGQDEISAYKRIITEVYPSGFVSIVSDTWDLWKVLDEVITPLKDTIMARDGKTVIRPDCYDEETQILTDSGWKYFENLSKSDRVAQVHDDGHYNFVFPTKYVDEYYEGEMVHFTDYHGKVDSLVTPNHRVVYQKGGELKKQDAEDITFYHTKDMIRSASSQDTFKELSLTEVLKIAFQADGSFTSTGNKIRFSFAKRRKIERMQSILDESDIEYKMYKLKRGNTEFNINYSANHMVKDFSWVDTSNLDANWCQEFIEELSYWDATRRHENRFKFDTTNEEVIDVVELISLSAGYGCLITHSEDNRKPHFSAVFTAHIMKDNRAGGQSISKEFVEYSGNIYCVTVPTGKILVKRNRSTLVSGNSGDPADTICGDPNGKTEMEQKGVVEVLWDIFGGEVSEQGYKVLDSHIGTIYGDAITLERCEEICSRLEQKGFASINVVYGIGSYTYQFNTRDTFGFALKSSFVIIDGEEKQIFKAPKTDTDGFKKSLKGRAVVLESDGELIVKDGLGLTTEKQEFDNLLEVVYINGTLIIDQTLQEIRDKVSSYL